MKIPAPSYMRSPEDPDSEVFVPLDSLRGDLRRSEAAITIELQAAQPIIDRAFICAQALGIDTDTFNRLVMNMVETSGGAWEKECDESEPVED